jgi:hypothetical protein
MLMSEHMTPVMYTDYSGYLSNGWKIGIGIGAIAIAAVLVVASGGTALPIIAAGLKMALISGAVSAGMGVGGLALSMAIKGESMDGFKDKAFDTAVDSFSTGFMLGGLFYGASMSLAAVSKLSSVHRSVNMSNKVRGMFGTQSGNYTFLRINKTFGFDASLSHGIHMHFPTAAHGFNYHRTTIVNVAVPLATGIYNFFDKALSRGE